MQVYVHVTQCHYATTVLRQQGGNVMQLGCMNESEKLGVGLGVGLEELSLL